MVSAVPPWNCASAAGVLTVVVVGFLFMSAPRDRRLSVTAHSCSWGDGPALLPGPDYQGEHQEQGDGQQDRAAGQCRGHLFGEPGAGIDGGAPAGGRGGEGHGDTKTERRAELMEGVDRP